MGVLDAVFSGAAAAAAQSNALSMERQGQGWQMARGVVISLCVCLFGCEGSAEALRDYFCREGAILILIAIASETTVTQKSSFFFWDEGARNPSHNNMPRLCILLI